MRIKRVTAALLGGVMAASILTGCGGVNKDETVATFDETEVKLGVANFAARLQQASYDDFYVAYFGEDVWSSDMYGNGSTMEDNIKDGVLESIFDMYTLKAHMDEYKVALTDDETSAIEKAASDFIAANGKDALKALGADDETVKQYLTLVTIQTKMHDAIVADADTNVSDEEANTGSYSYVRVSKTTYTDADGNSAEYTEEELAELEKKVSAFADEAKSGTLEDAAESNDYTVSSGTFTAEDENLDEAVLSGLKNLKEGEVSGVIDTDSNYYVVRLDKVTDEEATESTRESIISRRESDLYKEVLDGWKEKHDWKVNDKVWEKVTFDNLFTTTVGGTETESVSDTENVGDTERVSDTESPVENTEQ